MHRVSRILALLMVFAQISTFSLHAASDEPVPGGEGVYLGKDLEGVPLDGKAERQATPDAATGDREKRKALEQLLPPGRESVLQEQTKVERTDLQKKVKLVLTAEPGDGLVALSWRLLGLRLQPGDQPPRFTLYYGTESGRYDRKVEVGENPDHVLRGLKNQQAYFVKVQAALRITEEGGVTELKAPELSFFSPELRVIPLPAEEQGSLLEKSYARKTVTLQDKPEVDPFRRELKQFGYEFFKNSLAATMPPENVPVGPDYVLAPGDSLRIDIWGSIQGRHELAVDRNGEIAIPRVGTVRVWGLTYAQGRDAIQKAIARIYKGFELNVTLGKLRTIQVFIVGEVEAPGTYAVTSLATVINALATAGGPSKNGSLRSLRLLRGGKTVQEIDLYDMFLSGDRSKDVRLENGDTIFVPVIGPVAALAGEVKRPAIYELKGRTTLPELLAMGGGITAAGYTGRIQVERIVGNKSRVVVDYEPREGDPATMLAEVAILDRDLAKVFPVHKALRQVVSLTGKAARPGEYQYREGMRVSDLLTSFEAVLPDAYLEAAEVTRLVQPDFHQETLSFNLRKALAGDAAENIRLQEQDTVRIFAKSEMEEKPGVSVLGFVVNPGEYDYYPRMTVRDLVTAAGSLKRNALLDSAELTRVMIKAGKAQSSRVVVDLRKALAGDPDHNLTLQPDDVLLVREVSEWLESANRFVTLKGEVLYPGVYSITKGERLSSVIQRAGGFAKNAYLPGARYYRKAVQREQQKRMEEFIQRSELEVFKKQGELASVAASREELEATKAALEGIQRSLEKLKQTKAEGRVVLKLTKLETFTDSTYDLELQGGDVLEIPQTMSVIGVLGQVYNQTALVHQPGETVSFYLKQSGGATRDGDEAAMYVIHADGTVFSRQQSSLGIHWNDETRSWTFGSFMATPLQPGDILVVPQKLERIAWLREIKDITQILANVALTAGVIVAAFP